MNADTKYTSWTDDVHNDIMMAMYEALQPDKAQFAEIMTKLRQKGHEFSANALNNFISTFLNNQRSLPNNKLVPLPPLLHHTLFLSISPHHPFSHSTPSPTLPPLYLDIMATDGAGRTVWNDKTRSDLLLAITNVFHPTSEQWDTISIELRAKGYTYNYNAAIQHLQKLKKKEANGPPSMPSTPRKPKAAGAKTPKTPKSTGKKRKHEEPQDRDEDEDEEKILKKKVKHEDAPLNLDQFLKAETSTSEDGVIP
ncbi:hypothetical protein NPX13_g1141 [Xylaria arbuscula]|uniref:Uncharacterized protein n=1 Tax=Xylaria arbuscula TaxID=114810 RepID=A0A9W8NN23_9PEZI|nr:hypothetical protein NPX13_g1141 [Xylaria arbuscula]